MSTTTDRHARDEGPVDSRGLAVGTSGSIADRSDRVADASHGAAGIAPRRPSGARPWATGLGSPALLVVLGVVLEVVAGCAATRGGSEAAPYGFGSVPAPQELVRFVSPLPDGRGLPHGAGTVEQGRALYGARCASCHGDKLQGGIGDRLVGGRGTLANSDRTKAPVKTVESYWPWPTTLFDYIERAMPLTEPGSLSSDEVYALSAFILAQGGIVPPDAVMDERTLPLVHMPNRDGFIADPRPETFVPAADAPHS